MYTYIVLEASCTYHFGESLSIFLVSKWVHLRTKEASEIHSTPDGKWSAQSWWGTGVIQTRTSPRRYGNQSIFTSLATMRRASWWGTGFIINVRLTHGGFNLNSPLGSFQMQSSYSFTWSRRSCSARHKSRRTRLFIALLTWRLGYLCIKQKEKETYPAWQKVRVASMHSRNLGK